MGTDWVCKQHMSFWQVSRRTCAYFCAVFNRFGGLLSAIRKILLYRRVFHEKAIRLSVFIRQIVDSDLIHGKFKGKCNEFIAASIGFFG